jgi:predicted MFS family arabinose efflux permease
MTSVPLSGDPADVLAPPTSAFRKTRWGVIWLLTLTLFSALTVGGLFAPLLEPVKADMGMTDLQLGMLAGLATAIPIALLSVPLAWVVDHGNRTRLLIILASLWALGTIGTAFVDDFTTLFAVRLVAGIGGGCAFPVLISILADVCMPDRRGRSMLLVSIGAWGGAAAAFAVGGGLYGWLAANPTAFVPGMAPWRETHLITGVIAALLVLPLFLIKEPPRYEVETTSTDLREVVRAFWKRRAFLAPLFLGQLTGGMAEGAAALWIGSLMARQFGLTPGEFGPLAGMIILGSGVVGSVIGGFAADAGNKLKMRGGILLPALLATALTIPAGAYSIMPTVAGFCWVLFALLVGGTIVNLVTSAAIAVLIPNEERAMCLAGQKIASTVFGAVLMLPLIGWMTTAFEGPKGLGVAVAVVGVGTGVLSTIGFWLAMLNAPRPVASDPDAITLPAAA